MFVRIAAALVFVALVVGCGGGAGPTLAPGATPTATPTATLAGPPAAGDPIDENGISAALTALQALDSWTFDSTFVVKSLGNVLESSVAGTERRNPEEAVDAIHKLETGEFHYIHIGDDVWTTLATDDFYHYDAADSEDLIDQYEPSYIAGLVEVVSGFTRVEYDPIAEETVNGIATTHYQGGEADRENLVQTFSGITADQWAADIWLAKDGGYLVKLAWGPQTAETAQASQGFNYTVTSVNCTCPIEPPTNLASP